MKKLNIFTSTLLALLLPAIAQADTGPVIVEEVIIEEPVDVIIEDPIIVDEEDDFPIPGEDSNEDVRKHFGITDVVTERNDIELYNFREQGEFAISKSGFSSLSDAAAFCASLNTADQEAPFSVVTVGLSLGLTFMGLPFDNLHEASVVDVPVLESDGFRTGVVFWTLEDGQPTTDNVITAFTDGNGAGAGGMQNVEELNKRLAEQGEGPVNVPVICVDENLETALDL
ncbi:MAG: hypothetical protein HRT45_16415 [Bdellovibrionales bacterium]|nr:hypothetical protein [Bdellovibrionales bacterium]